MAQGSEDKEAPKLTLAPTGGCMKTDKEQMIEDYLSGDLCAEDMPDLINIFLNEYWPERRKLQNRGFVFGLSAGLVAMLLFNLWR